MALGIALAILVYAATAVAVVLVSAALDRDPVPEDVGDIFEKASRVVQYADRRLEAASTGRPLPSPPRLVGDPVVARAAFLTAIASGVLLVAAAVVATRTSIRTVAQTVGLRRLRPSTLWQPVVLWIAAYVFVLGYSLVVEAIGIDILIPADQVPRTAARDDVALALFGVVALLVAPLSEEGLFRGLIFTGLLRWGFWPAALVSGTVFGLSHVDPGLYIPFTGVGIAMAWIYARHRCLWHSIVFHALFNGTSFVVLLATR